VEEKAKDGFKHLLVHNQAKAMLNDKAYPYILVTCNPDEGDGNVEVELSFNGNEDLLGCIVKQVGEYFQPQ
jgi:hypothetical protein